MFFKQNKNQYNTVHKKARKFNKPAGFPFNIVLFPYIKVKLIPNARVCFICVLACT